MGRRPDVDRREPAGVEKDDGVGLAAFERGEASIAVAEPRSVVRDCCRHGIDRVDQP